MRFVLAACSLLLLSTPSPADACTPPPPDAGPAPDANPPAGDVLVFTRSTEPPETSIPTNMRFVVTYELHSLGGTIDWLGDIGLRVATGGEPLAADVTVETTTRGGLETRRYTVTPKAPLPAQGYVELTDRFVAVPCGTTAACAERAPAAFASFKVAFDADVAKPQLTPQTVVISDWKGYSQTETCMNTVCAGYRIQASFPAAVDPDTASGGVSYRMKRPDGSIVELQQLVVSTAMECTSCFHLEGNPAPKTELGPFELWAVDWLGHESDGHIFVTFAAPPSCSSLSLDGGLAPPDATAASPDGSARTPDAASATAKPSESGGGCAVAGGRGGAGGILFVLGLLGYSFFTQRRRSIGS
jgi:hypothetical protein